MPSEVFFDPSSIDQNNIAITQEEIYQLNPHRYEFMLLDGIFFLGTQQKIMAGYRDIKDDEFWVRGHIPGRPIFPGVLMIETAAQLVSYFAKKQIPGKGFLGFSGVDEVKFRGQVVPGDRLIMVAKMVEFKPRRCIGATQGFVNGKMVYEGIIKGMWL